MLSVSLNKTFLSFLPASIHYIHPYIHVFEFAPSRKPLLPTPDAMTKVERRQLFEAQVRAQDEMNAEIQRQHDEYVKQMYEQDPNYQPQFDPNLAQFMQQEQGQYQRHVGGGCRGGGCRGGGCTSRTPTTSPSSTPTWPSSCSKSKVSTRDTWVGCVGVGGVRAGPQLQPPVRPQPGAVHAAGTRSVPETHGWGV